MLGAALGTRSARSGSGRDELVEFVGLGELRDADVGTLSFGQGRLLEIARALAGEPRLILFDEPAAGLTPAEIDAPRRASSAASPRAASRCC